MVRKILRTAAWTASHGVCDYNTYKCNWLQNACKKIPLLEFFY